MLPNLVIIGAAKAGTTSLHYYLGLHPEISMSATKELRFFSHDRLWNRGVDWYEGQFQGDARVHGEASPSYTMYPRYPESAPRLHSTIPQAKLVYVVRDPIARIVSHYLFAHSDGREPAPFEEAIRAEDSRYVACSRYYLQIARYLEHFGPAQILVIAQEELAHDLRPTLQTVFRFLDVDDTFWSPAFALRLNEARGLHFGPIGRGLARLNRYAIVQRLPLAWRLEAAKYLYRPFSTPVERPVVSDDLRADLVARLEDDLRRFRAWTGRDFAEWSV
jgi:Sulfotransferase domain